MNITTKEKTTRSNQSTEKAFVILEFLADEKKPMRLQDIAAGVDTNASTVLRFLSTLQKCGYVAQDSETLKYFPTMKICALASKVAASTKLSDIVRPSLRYLSHFWEESASLAVEQNMDIVYIDVEEGPDQMLRTMQRIGNVAPMHCTGIGKLHLLNYSEAEIDLLILKRGLQKFTENTVTTKAALLTELSRIKEAGYAFDNEECEMGARCVAVPIRDYTGKVVAGISVTGPLVRMTEQKITEKLPVLLDAAHTISKTLGFLD